MINTAILGFPVPEPPDDVVVPAHMLALAEAIEAVLANGDQLVVASPGDLKFSARNADHGRWLLADGRELNGGEIEAALSLDAGQADDLLTLLGTGSSCVYGNAASGKIKLPELAQTVPVLAGAGGNDEVAGVETDRPLKGAGSSGGEEKHLLVANESGVATHTHTITDPGHIHTLTDPGHSHGHGEHHHDSSIATNGSAFVQQSDFGYEARLAFGADLPILVGAMQNNGDSISSATTGISLASHATGINATNAAAGASAAQGHENMPPFRVVGYGFLRV